jgi:small subunit ribosomal protein S3
MGQKIHPTGFRLAVTRDWSSRWYANSKNFAGMLNEDVQAFVTTSRKSWKHASVGRVLIERPAKNARVTVFPLAPVLSSARRVKTSISLRCDLQKIMGVPVHVDRRNPQAGTRRTTDCRLDRAAA